MSVGLSRRGLAWLVGLGVLCGILAGQLAHAGAAFALESVGQCENGWQFYDDGNAYQCDPGSAGGSQDQDPAQGQAGAGGGPGAGGPMTPSELERLRKNPPRSGWYGWWPPGEDSVEQLALFAYNRSPTAQEISLLEAWYRDAFVRNGRSAPGTAGNARYCSVQRGGGGANNALVGCSKSQLSAPECAAGPVVRVGPHGGVVTDGSCDEASSFLVGGDPEHGRAEVRDGRVVYVPDAGFEGDDRVPVVGIDGTGGTIDQFLVAVHVNGRPSCVAPTGVTTVERGQPSRVALQCSDPDGDAVSVSAAYADGALAEHGALTGHGGWVSSDGGSSSFAFVSDERYLGDDEVVVRAVDSDGLAALEPTRVGVRVVEPALQCPGGVEDFDGQLEDGIPVRLSCGLPGGVPLLSDVSYGDLSGPAHGRLVDVDLQAGTFTYVPDHGFRGVDHVRFTAGYAGQSTSADVRLTASRPTP